MTARRNVLTLIKPACNERFIFVYDDEPTSVQKVLSTLGRFAVAPDLTFTWYDAAYLASKVLERREERAKEVQQEQEQTEE